ncbi:MAG: hypothetical protein ACK2TV_06625 [Anaerolineales bacterium]
MSNSIETVLSIVIAGVLLIAGVFILNLVIKFAWKILRFALIALAVLLIAGIFLGVIEIPLPW